MMQGYSLSANLPEETGLGERFWYWRGASGQCYIHSIYAPDHCPPVAGAVFVIVRKASGVRMPVWIGRFGADGLRPLDAVALTAEDEIHVHLLVREGEAADGVLKDLSAALEDAPLPRAEPKPWRRPVQLDLLAA